MPLDRRGRRITVSEKTVRDILNDGREDTENQVLKETEIKAITINKKKEYKSDGINQWIKLCCQNGFIYLIS